MANIPDEKIALLDKPSTLESVPFEERNLFLTGEDTKYCQVGCGVAANGTGFVCNETYMPGVSGEMLDWWFPWHSIGSDLRYKIWDCEDHYFARADKADYVCDAAVPVNQKTWGVNHYVLEDIGNGPGFLKIQFKRPRDFGLDEGLIGGAKCQSLVAGIGDGERFSLKITGYRPFRYRYVDGQMKISTNPKEWSDPSWIVPCNGDVEDAQHRIQEKIRSRGLYDTFMAELAHFLLNRKKYKITCRTTVAQLADIPNHWLARWRIGGMVGWINKVSYQLAVDKPLGKVEIEFYAF